MGVDFWICHYCRDTFADCGPYTTCNEMCGIHWCQDSCAMKEGWKTYDRDNQTHECVEYCEEEGHPDYLAATCNFCRKESATDKELFEYLLKKNKLTREKVEKEFLKTK